MGLDTASFQDGVKRAQSISKRLQGHLKEIGIGAAGVAAGFAAMAKMTINSFDDMAKSAQKVGVSVEELSKLSYAAELSGVSAQTLQTGLTRLNVAVSDIAGTSPEATRSLRALGIEAGTNASDALAKLADKFQRMPDGAQKSALAVQIFGRSGAELIPLLNSGSEGLAAMQDEAERLGIVIDTKAAKGAEIFNDNLTRLQRVQSGVTSQIVTGMVPTLVVLTNELVESAKAGNIWQGVGRGIASAMVTVAESATEAVLVVKGLKNELVAFFEAGKLPVWELPKAFAMVRDASKKTQEDLAANAARFAAIREKIAAYEMDAATVIVPPVPAPSASGIPIVKTAGAVAEKAAEAAKSMAQLREEAVGAAGVLQDVSRSIEAGASMHATSLESMVLSAEQVRDILGGSAWLNAMEQAQTFARGVSDNLAQAIVYGRSIGDALVASFKAAAAEALANGLFQMLLGGGGGGGGGLIGGIAGGLFGGAREKGGPVAAGRAYLVGERGPELFMPKTSGQVFSNSATKGMGGTVINVDARGSSDPAMVEIAARRGAAMALSTVADMARQGQRARLPGGRG